MSVIPHPDETALPRAPLDQLALDVAGALHEDALLRRVVEGHAVHLLAQLRCSALRRSTPRRQLVSDRALAHADDLRPSRGAGRGRGARPGKPIKVHVKVEAGMGRLGVRIDECAAFVRDVLATPGLHLEGMYTHIPFSNDAGEAWSRRRSRHSPKSFAWSRSSMASRSNLPRLQRVRCSRVVFRTDSTRSRPAISRSGCIRSAAPVLRRSASARRLVHFGLSSSTSDGGAWVTIFPAPVRAGWITMQRSA